MKYYIIKPQSHAVSAALIERLKAIDDNILIVEDIHQADKVILQKGWTRSNVAVAEHEKAKDCNIPCVEQYMLDTFKVHLNTV